MIIFMTEVGSPPEAEVNLASRRQIGYFDRTVNRRLAKLDLPRDMRQINRITTGGLEFDYQIDVRDHKPYFTARRAGSEVEIEYGREGDRLLRTVFLVTSEAQGEVLSERPVTYDEAQALLVVMRRPKAFTAENPPSIVNLSPEEAELVARAGIE